MAKTFSNISKNHAQTNLKFLFQKILYFGLQKKRMNLSVGQVHSRDFYYSCSGIGVTRPGVTPSQMRVTSLLAGVKDQPEMLPSAS